MGWTQVVFNHITIKIPGTEKLDGGPHFLINSFGLRFDEATASSLLKVYSLYHPPPRARAATAAALSHVLVPAHAAPLPI
jgi:ribulose-5-phosphate 4-epimerase/fuculose-1-phosphate aldolase